MQPLASALRVLALRAFDPEALPPAPAAEPKRPDYGQRTDEEA